MNSSLWTLKARSWCCTAISPAFDRNFYAAEEQDRLIALLLEKAPAAVITLNHYAGAIPVVIEYSEFTIPSVTVSGSDGLWILENAGAQATLNIASERHTGTGTM
ncbi:MAG: hypothetical protein AB1497_06700 [Bacillota bacterium]